MRNLRVRLQSSSLVCSAVVVCAWLMAPASASGQTGLVAAYGFDEGVGTTVADASGNNNAGSIGTATWSTGKYGNALQFNGTSARVTIPDAASLHLTTGMTLEAWVYPTTVNGAWRDVIYKADDNYYLEGTSTASGSAPTVGGTFGGANANVYGTSGLALNAWTHLAATYDETTLRLYVNGVQVSSAARTGNLATSTNALSIGGDNLYGQYFVGRIDDVRVYDVARTAAQIQSDMNTPVGGGGGTPTPDLTITKTHSGNFIRGQVGATYTLTASNVGTAATSGIVTVTDTLPSGLTATALSGTGWACTLATLSCTRSDAIGSGASYPAVTVTVNVSGTAPASVTNTATIAGGGESNTANDTATDVTTITAVPDLTVVKTHTGNFSQGQVGATYSITVTNSGGAATSGTVTVIDTLPTGLTATALSGTGWNCNLSQLRCTRSTSAAAGASYPTITLTVTVSNTAPASVTNSVTVGGGGESNTANDTATNVTIINGPPDLTIAKSHSGNFNQGQVGATYAIAVTNNGTGPTSGTITVNDTLPAGLTATAFSGAGWTCTLSPLRCTRSDALAGGASFPALTLTVTVSNTAPSSVTNTAAVSGGGETNTANDTANDVTTISGLPDLTIAKTHSGNFAQGQVGASYTLTVSNAGTLTSGTVTVTDTLPSGLTATALSGTGWTCTLATLTCTRSDGLAAGASYPALTLTINVSNTAPASVTNTATVGGGGESNTSDDTASDLTTINGIPDLRISKTHAGNFTQGQVGATYTLTASNAGTGPSSETVTVTDTLPSGLTATALSGTGWTCTLATLTCTRSDVVAAGASYPALTLTVNVSATAPASVTNTATISGGGESNTANNTASDVTTIGAVPDLTIAKTHSGNFTQGQAGATYSLVVSNSGAAATTGTVTVTDTLPSGLTATALSGTGWTCTLATLTCTRSDAVPAGASYSTVTLTVTVSGTAPASVTNTATVSGGGESNTANDTTSDITTINGVPDLTIAKTHASSFTQGQIGATYALTVSNGGGGATTGTVTVTDTLPSGLTATALSGTGWSCTLATLTCTRTDALGAGASYPVVTLTVNVSNSAPANVTNTAAVSGGGESNTSNNTATDPTTVNTQVSGLSAAYGFNDGTGSTVSDASGNGNTGNIGAATWTTSGKYGNALQFNGTSARVSIPDAPSLHLTNAMTLEAWVYPTTVNTSWRDVIYKGNDNYYLEGTSTGTGGAPAVGGLFGGANANVYGSGGLALNAWSHLAATYDGATLRLYVNGVQVSSAARTGNLSTSTNPLEIGGDSLWGQYFSGRIDEVRVYSVALTASQIQADMNTPVTGGGGTPSPDLSLTKSHSGNFARGQVGATYTLTVTNNGAGATSGTVTVTDTLPSGLTATAISGTGWACTLATLTCTRTDALAAAGSYPSITLTVDVATSAPASVTNSATVSVAGDTNSGNNTATDSTTISTTLDTEPPSAPGTLTAVATSGTSVDLSWGAATDNIGVTGYRIERCEGVGCTVFVKLSTANPTGTTYTDTGLVPNTTYRYMVRAGDAAGNLGDYSNIATTTTLSTVPELVLAYAFSEGSGTTVADLSGKGNVGTLLNATWTTNGKYGNALFFNGSNARVTVPNSTSLQLSTATTLEAWVNPSTVTNTWRDVIYKGNDIYYLEATSTSSTGVPAVGGTFAPSPAFASSALQVGTWAHVAATYDGATLRLYVNGVQVASASGNGSIGSSTNAVEIGGDALFGQNFHGSIDEVRIYNVARTPTQIQSDMNTPVGTAVPIPNLNPTSVSFGTRAINTPGDPVEVTLTNVGGAQLAINGISITGTNSGDFAQTNNCAATLDPGMGCTISVTFTATALGNRSATLRVDDSGNGSPHTVALSGTSVAVLVTPAVAAIAPNDTQQFTATGGGVINFIWSVDSVVGGSASTGTITASGVYTAPATAGTHVITASTPDLSQSGTATVHVVNASGVSTFHNDSYRTGLNANEAILTKSNVNSATFGKLGSYNIDGQAIATPLYVGGVSMPGQGVHDVVYVATEHDSVYAFDANLATSNPLWKVSFLGSNVTTVPANDTNECCDISPEIGITGTPVIDQVTGTLYVVAKTKEGSGGNARYVQRLHALDITTGAEKFGGPVEIQATVPGDGSGSVNGQLSFDPLRHNQRPALLLDRNVVYIAWGSHGDAQPYHGWVMGYNATTLQQTMAFCATPDGEGGGVWLGGDGLAGDAAGNIYFITGDGTFDANTGGRDYGDTFVKLSPNGTVVDYFTPSNQAQLDTANHDLGSSNVTLLPDQPGAHPHLALEAGKNATIHMVDRDNMGHYTNNDQQIVQSLVNIFPFGTPEPGNYSAAVYFNGFVYFSPVADNVQAFRLTNGLLSTSPVSRTPEIYAYPGGAMSVSSNGVNEGILWAIQYSQSQAGVLRAYDAASLNAELYNSQQVAGDSLDFSAKFTSPVVANGKVFVASSGRLTVFGLRP